MVLIGEIWCQGNGWKRIKSGACNYNAHIPSRKPSRKLPGSSRPAGFLIVGFSLPVSLPGNFPDLPGLRPFERNRFSPVSASRFSSRKLPGSSRTAFFLIVGFSLPVSLPGNFPDLPGLRCFERNSFWAVSPSRFSSRKLPGLRPFAIPPKTYDNGSGF